jgi:hypothetical protein
MINNKTYFNMIHADELMIGNYIFDGVQLQIVEGIEHDGCWCRSINGAISFFYDYDNLYPTPIDENWLTDFGFKKRRNPNNTPTWIYVKDREIWYYQQMETLKFEIRYFGLYHQIELKYVHQLQNLYFTLTGKKLTII